MFDGKTSQKGIAVVQPRNDKRPGQEVAQHALSGRPDFF